MSRDDSQMAPGQHATADQAAASRRAVANRANARLSTGPRTAQGKAASAANATRHGLAAAPRADPARQRRLADLAHALAGPAPSVLVLEHAFAAAAAELALRDVEDAERALLAPLVQGGAGGGGQGGALDGEAWAAAAPALGRLTRYQRRAFSAQRKAFRALDEALVALDQS